jgi:AmmeMemoRadiSam system protein B
MPRIAAVAGRFYPSQGEELRVEVLRLLGAAGSVTPRPAVGLMAPHAAYAFSGPVAASTYARVVVPDRVIILAPNHTGLGARVAVAADGPFVTPMGEVPLDEDLSARIVAACPEAVRDDLAHAEEHGVEVHLPFLLARNPRVRVAAVCLRTMSCSLAEAVGEAVATAVKACGEPVLIVASSDLNHHEPRRVAARKDRMVLERLTGLDPRGLYGAAVEHHVSMCGLVPAVAMLVAVRALGARSAELASYACSGDANGDDSSVVGYAGVLFTIDRTHEIVRAFQAD